MEYLKLRKKSSLLLVITTRNLEKLFVYKKTSD